MPLPDEISLPKQSFKLNRLVIKAGLDLASPPAEKQKESDDWVAWCFHGRFSL